MTPYFVRERQRNLNHGTVLHEAGRCARKSVNYHWKEPVDPGALRAFHAFHRMLADRAALAVDAFRLVDAFGGVAFSAPPSS